MVLEEALDGHYRSCTAWNLVRCVNVMADSAVEVGCQESCEESEYLAWQMISLLPDNIFSPSALKTRAHPFSGAPIQTSRHCTYALTHRLVFGQKLLRTISSSTVLAKHMRISNKSGCSTAGPFGDHLEQTHIVPLNTVVSAGCQRSLLSKEQTENIMKDVLRASEVQARNSQSIAKKTKLAIAHLRNATKR